MSDISEALRSELRDPEYSEGYAESFLNSYIATQIKVLREQRKMKQADLAQEIGTTQTAISRIEDINYSSWNIKTLKRLARAFRVRLSVSFEPYGTLPGEVEHFTRESLQRAARESDPGLADVAAAGVGSILDAPLPHGAGNVIIINAPPMRVGQRPVEPDLGGVIGMMQGESRHGTAFGAAG
jgi:transcriptional regulator with XRE-family HTH domain